MNGSQITGRGDLGRRVTRRREELGLTVEELAGRAEVAPEYLDYIERSTAVVTTGTLVKLSQALKISAWALLGEESAWPSTPATPGPQQPGSRLEGLSEAECRRLIAPGGTGRVIFTTSRGPAAVPVNYAVYRDRIVFRTAQDGGLAAMAGGEVGFEIDEIDPGRQEGWSVLAVGRLAQIINPAELGEVHKLVRPWAGEDRRLGLRLDIERISGRRVRGPATKPADPPPPSQNA
jgi:transcriptional regulator with XRE-family HTH domain